MDRISTELRQAVSQAQTDIFESFKKTQPVRFYQVASETFSVFDPNYNGDFQEMSETNNITRYANYRDIDARVIYMLRQDISYFVEGGEELGIRTKQLYNRIKIQIKVADFDYLKSATKFMFWDEEYQIDEGWKRLGILGVDHLVQVVLKRVN